MSRDALYLCDSCVICRNGIELEILTMPVLPGRCDLCSRTGERSAAGISRDDSLAHCPERPPRRYATTIAEFERMLKGDDQ